MRERGIKDAVSASYYCVTNQPMFSGLKQQSFIIIAHASVDGSVDGSGYGLAGLG